jgi:DNA repair protein RecO (recombination protein O)
MSKTYVTSAVILRRQAFRENDARVVAYSSDQGRLELVARGTRKTSSKLAGHLEPLTSVDLLVVKGRQFDYVGSAASDRSFYRLKNDSAATRAAGQGVRYFISLIKEGVEDARLYELLVSYFCLLDSQAGEPERLYELFVWRLLALLGFAPRLGSCAVCSRDAGNRDAVFFSQKGGLVCSACRKGKTGGLPLPLEARIYLRKIAQENILDSARFEASLYARQAAGRVVQEFSQYIQS